MKLSFSDSMRSGSMWTRSAYWRVLSLLFCCSIYFSGVGGQNTLSAQTPVTANFGSWDQACGEFFPNTSPPEQGRDPGSQPLPPGFSPTGKFWEWSARDIVQMDFEDHYAVVYIGCDGGAAFVAFATGSQHNTQATADEIYNKFQCHQIFDAGPGGAWFTTTSWGAGNYTGYAKVWPAGSFRVTHNACEEECDDEADGDADGINDCDDDDDDGDGIPDEDDDNPEPDPYNPGSCIMDSDGDGVPNCNDNDDDGDGVPDSEDTCNDGVLCEDGQCYPFNPERPTCDCWPSHESCDDGGEEPVFEPDCEATDKVTDTDGDGCPNFLDRFPSTNDTYPCAECPGYGYEPDCEATDKTTDSDSDGCPNYRDKYPQSETYGGAADECPFCKNCDAYDKQADSDGDGCKNYLDPFPQTSGTGNIGCYTCPEDPDDDLCEQMCRDLDGDGCPDVKDQFPTNPDENGGCIPIDADGDGCPDWLDTEPDNAAVKGDCIEPDCSCSEGDCELKYEEFKTEFAALFASFVPNFSWQSLNTYVNDNFYFDIGWHVAGQDSLLFDYKWYPSKGIAYKGVFQFSATYQLCLATMKTIIGGLCTLQLVFVIWKDIRSF